MQAAQWGPEEDHRFQVRPYHTLVPTFGTWGFAIAGENVPEPAELVIQVPTRYLTTEVFPGLFIFPPDMAEVASPVSSLDDPVVSRLYRVGYHKYLD
jgi:spermidine synthase